MKKNGKKRSLWPVIALILVLMTAVAAMVVFKQYEYGVSADFYDGLRGGVKP